MLGVLSPRGGCGDWIAADETQLYFTQSEYILQTHTHTHKLHEYVCAIIRYRRMHKTIWEVAHNAIFDAWQSKVWFGEAATWVEIAGVQNLPLRHTFYTSLISSNAFHRQISVSGDLLLWLRIAFGGGFLSTQKENLIIWDYSFIVVGAGEEEMLFWSWFWSWVKWS